MILYKLHALCLAQLAHEYRLHVQYPRDWWEAFKARWFPVWVLRSCPVQYTVIDERHEIFTSVCPHLPAGERDPHVFYLGGIDRGNAAV